MRQGMRELHVHCFLDDRSPYNFISLYIPQLYGQIGFTRGLSSLAGAETSITFPTIALCLSTCHWLRLVSDGQQDCWLEQFVENLKSDPTLPWTPLPAYRFTSDIVTDMPQSGGTEPPAPDISKGRS